jgi:hypothetical protein
LHPCQPPAFPQHLGDILQKFLSELPPKDA